jgi:preprotein translocase subunit SecG
MKTNNESESLELFLSIYLFIKKFFILFLIFIILGIAYGFYKNKTSKNSFNKEILVYSEDISYILIKQFSIVLGKDIDAGNYKEISKKIFLDETICKKIIGTKTDSISQRGKVYALTTFTFSDTAGTSNFSENYKKYLSSSEYIHKILESNREKFTKILEKINQKIQELDATNGKINGNSNSEYIELYSKKVDCEDKLKNKSEIDIVRETNSVEGPRFGRMVSCIIYGMIFFVISLVIGFLIELLGKVRKLEKSRK